MSNRSANRDFHVPAGLTLVALLLTIGTTAALVTASGCNGAKGGPNAGPAQSPAPATGWGVYFWAPGRNTASPQIQTAITNLTKVPAGKTTTVPVVLETAYSTLNDGTAPFTTTKRILAQNGTLAQLQDLGSQSLVDPNELAAFIQTARTNIPNAATNVMIVMGPGGFPFLGVGADSSGGNMDLAAFDAGLGAGIKNAGLNQIDILVLDMPEGSTAEMISVARKHASFVVALESGASTSGFDYLGLATLLANNANPSVASVVQTILNGLLSVAQQKNKDQVSELIDASVDLSKASAIMQAINNLGAALVADLNTTAATLPNVIAAIGSCRASAAEMDVHAQTSLVDLASFAASLATVNTSSTNPVISGNLVTACQNMNKAVGSNVSTGTVGPVYAGAKGLAVYFPHSSKTNNTNYATSAAAFVNDAPQWLTFLTTYFAAVSNGAVTPTVSNLVVPTAVAQGSKYTVSATIFPNNTIHNVTLLVTQVQSGQNVVLSRLDLGAPDATTGNISASPFMVFCAASAGTTDGPFIFPLARNNNAAQGTYFAVDCDQIYTTAAGSTTLPGFMKTSDVAGVGSAVAWTAYESNGALARNDFTLVSAPGVTYTLFPRTVVVDSSGHISSVSQNANALRSSSGVIKVDPSQLLNQTLPVPVTVWIVAESFNGDVSAATASVTVQ